MMFSPKRSLKFLLAVGVMVGGLVLPIQTNAGTFDVFVGYADNLRASPFFPNPFFGSPSVELFAGQNPNVFSLDAGAIRIRNTGVSDITINSLSVQLKPAMAGPTFTLWSGSLPFVLHPGKDAIFTQTTQFNFDTSDFPFVAANLADNCSVGPLHSTSLCMDNSPRVDVTVDSVLTSPRDTGHVLDTGGFDAVCCLPNGNESLQWRLIGTSGIQNPGGQIPEPASLLLLGSGLAGLAAWRRAKK